MVKIIENAGVSGPGGTHRAMPMLCRPDRVAHGQLGLCAAQSVFQPPRF
jgi:hypothetical protein